MILVTGAKGQLGSDIIKGQGDGSTKGQGDGSTVPFFSKNGTVEPSPCPLVEPSPCPFSGIDIDDLDITDSKAVSEYLREHKPRSVIHCAAYTAVDKAEDEPELCYRVNAEGTENIAKACKEIDAEMLYISTDYVFNGDGDDPYETDAVKAPISVYGKSKLAGEEAVLRHLKKYYIVRISWVFGQNGNNFVKTMLKLAETRDELSVVCDQTGSPTFTPDLARLLADMTLSGKYGIYHATNEGFCTWAEFAMQIMKLTGKKTKINPITSAEYLTKAKRPKNSRLSKRSLDDAGFSRLPTWQDALTRYFT